MAARKRPLSGVAAQDAPAPKMAKADTNNSWRDLYELEVKAPSLDEATQDDWKTLASAHLKIHTVINGNPTPQLTDQQRIIYGNVNDHHIPETGNLDCIGSCSGVLIKRDNIRYIFRSTIGEAGEEALVMGFGQFDDCGRLKPVFKRGSVRSARMPNIVFRALLEAFDAAENDAARLELTQAALDSYGPEEDIWISADRKGNTLLHYAAISGDLTCVKWIMEKCPRLVTARNHQRNTPLDEFQTHLEVIRTQQKWGTKTVAVSDKFTGYSQPHVEMLCTLQGLSNLSLEELLRLKYGCTCGQCQEGFLSPRMRFTLAQTADDAAAMVSDECTWIDGKLFLKKYERYLMYLRPRVYDEMRTSSDVRLGFLSLFSHFALCLRDSTEPPHELKVLEMVISTKEEEESTMAKHYLDFGGTVEAVGSALFRDALTNSTGIASIWGIFESRLRAVPACRNDEEFGFVSGMCGYERVRRGQCLSATGHFLGEYDF
ncbi:hypothetical protein TGAM01_v201786 [Trichoderma gamsii]|uniref:Ankyrin repeat protein n=1 Tax=Trichoderma gamsii TaxID=398673 RepID=A0A2P4ZZ09_9HYPO|nr:hypothetical protein TGAM01_v201786 [Trichoderma gamsii]PON29537.1 hypothetical protein TGAM01_v201786 [Trichoderma gamsii]